MSDLQQRFWISLCALMAYRLGGQIPVPGIDTAALVEMYRHFFVFDRYPWAVVGQLPGLSIFGLSVVPYLLASFLMRMASVASPRLRALENRTPAGRRKVLWWTLVVATVFAVVQAFGFAVGVESYPDFVADPGPVFRVTAVASMTAGFLALIWLADQITRRGIGNGIALILFADAVTNLPVDVLGAFELTRTGAIPFGSAVALTLLAAATLAVVVDVERAVRPVIAACPEQRVGGLNFRGGDVRIDLKLNNAGFIPAMIAPWLLTSLIGVAGLIVGADGAGWYLPLSWRMHPAYLAGLAVLIVALTYAYALALLDPKGTARNLEDKGARIAGVRPGRDTERELRRISLRLALFGGGYLALIYLLPEILFFHVPSINFTIGGTGFLIAVAVAMDTLKEVAWRLCDDYRDGPPGEALEIAMELPARLRVSAAGR